MLLQDVVNARGGAAHSSRGDGWDSETWRSLRDGQQLGDSSELKFVLKGGKLRADGRSIQGKVGGEQFREQC